MVHRRTSGIATMIQYIILGCVLCTVAGIQLESFSTKKPRIIKYFGTTPMPDAALTTGSLVESTPAPVLEPSFTYLYGLNSSSGATCILLKTDALLSFEYIDKLGEKMIVDTYLPDNATVTGNCDYEDTETMTLAFKNFTLVWNFAKTPGGERWYVSDLQLNYSTSNRIFEQIDKPDTLMSLTNRPNTPLFPTPVGKSYRCIHEIVITLENRDSASSSNQTATLYLRDFQLQAFMSEAKNAFGPIFNCSTQGLVEILWPPFSSKTVHHKVGKNVIWASRR